MECLLVEIVVDYRVTRTRHRVGLRSTTNLCVGGFNNSSVLVSFLSSTEERKERVDDKSVGQVTDVSSGLGNVFSSLFETLSTSK